ncbi:MAG: hypothetical protein JSS97_14930 [Actinobacteria bacterium]|nr:hypothetical protein [Actinomycetota bacterium]
MAVDPATGDLYVIDLEDQTLHRFKPNGEPDPFSGLGGTNVIDGKKGPGGKPCAEEPASCDVVPGVEEILSTESPDTGEEVQVAIAPPGSAGGTAGDIYVTNAHRGQIDIFSPTGAFIASNPLTTPCGVSVGPTGDVYVGNYSEGVYKLIPSAPGVFAPAAGSPFPAAEACNVAAGSGPSAGSVFYSAFGGKVFRLDASSGAAAGEVWGGLSQGGISVDPVTGHLYVGAQEGAADFAIREFEASGATGAGEVSKTPVASRANGVAVDGTSGDLYLTRGGSSNVEVFGPAGSGKSLSIVVEGTGTVECEKEAAASFGACNGTYAEGEVVKLKATAVGGSGFVFGGWSAFIGSGTVTRPCTGAQAECEVKMTGNVTGKATFKPVKALTITTVGSGAVECEDEGATSFTACASNYGEGHVVTLKVKPANHFSFDGWSEVTGSGAVTTACTGTVTECEVKLSADVTGKATFSQKPKSMLTVTKSGAGAGTVESVPGGINCGPTCQSEFFDETTVTLEEAAAPGSAFVEWTGACTGSLYCHVTIAGAAEVGAVFAIVQHSLTITKAGNGGGSIACNGGACASSYPYGTTVTLTATPDSNSNFTGWSGSGCSGTGSCAITMNADAAVTASFDKKAEQHQEPPKAHGIAGASSVAAVTGNTAAVKLTCPTTGACEGKLTLKYKFKQGKKQKTVVAGTAPFSIGAGQTKTIKVKITNSQVKKNLSKGKTVAVQLTGSGIKASTLKLKPSKPKKH